MAGPEAFLTGGISRKLHLHARRIRIDAPEGGKIDVTAELPTHFAETLATLGFESDGGRFSADGAERCALARGEAAKSSRGGQGQAPRAPGRAAVARVGTEAEAALNRLAIFDCDGTLVDSGATIHAALGDASQSMVWSCRRPKSAAE